MVKSLENVAPFLLKCYEMVEDESTNGLISWNESDENSFIIWDVPKFSSELLPKYFKHSNFSSFIRQLNIYELVKLRQHQQNSESKLILVREQLKVMEKNQQQMLSFIVMAMQSPSFLVQFFQPKENNWRTTENGNNILSDVEEDMPSDRAIVEEDMSSDRAIVRYHPPTHEAACAEPEPALDTQKKPMELDLSSDEIKDLFSNIDFFSGLMDEKLLSFENSVVPLTLPDISDADDDMLEQLLLSCPITDNKEGEGEEIDNKAHSHADMEADLSFQPIESGTFVGSQERPEDKKMETVSNNSSNMDRLTEKMGHTKF